MLERVSKAEIAYSLQSGGTFGTIDELIQSGLLPEDIKSSESTGYDYAIDIRDDRKDYSATATPAVYGKTGKMSFHLRTSEQGLPHVSGKDTRGKILKM